VFTAVARLPPLVLSRRVVMRIPSESNLVRGARANRPRIGTAHS
jgi:hypothetical protein